MATNNTCARIIILCVSALATLSANAQTFSPQWMHKLPQSSPDNNSYMFIRIEADATSRDAGRAKCFQLLALDQSLLNTLTISYSSKDYITSATQIQNGNFSETLDQKTFEVITTEGKPIKIKARTVDEFFVPERQSMATLYQVALVPDAVFDNYTKTTSYASDPAMWGLSLVPGAAQMYKGSWLKGGLVLGSSVALAGGALTCGLIRNDNFAKMANTHSSSVKQQYAARANMFNTGMYCCLGGLAALYVYNLIDAAVAPGARRIIVYPTVADNGSIGLGGSIRF